MFNLFSKQSTSQSIQIKGLKVSLNSDRSKKFGIAASSLAALRKKVETKFNFKNFNLYLHDGSLIAPDDEEYFQTIPPQSMIIVGQNEEEIKTDLQLIIESFRKINHEVLQTRDLVREFVLNNQDSDVLKALNHVQNEIEERSGFSSRQEDPSWFEGLDLKVTTKEELLRRKAQDRIKGYFYKTKDELTKSSIYRTNAKARVIIDDLLSDFFLFLNGVDYFSCMFDRKYEVKFVIKDKVNDETDAASAKPKRRRIDSETKLKISESDLFKKFQVALCNDLGSFDCHGIWSANHCSYDHKINPYSSREAVLLFQIYNLDHQIEISRSIFPSILKNIEKLINGESCEVHNKKGSSISTLTYFKEIFTVGNLKLVHIVCHDKSTHDELKSKGRILCTKCNEFKKLQKIKLKIS